MNILTELQGRLNRLGAWSELDVDAEALPSSASRLSDASVLEILAEVGAIANDADRLQAVLAGVAATRSSRDRGQGGLAAGQGFSTPEKLIQSITGGTRADAVRQVRVGTSLVEGTDAAPPPCVPGLGVSGGTRLPESGADESGGSAGDGVPEAGTDGEVGAVGEARVRVVPWDEPLRRGLLDGRLTTAQHDAIRRGLGEPRAATAEGGAVPGAMDAPTRGTEPDANGAAGSGGVDAPVDDGDPGAESMLFPLVDLAQAAPREAMAREAWSLAAEALAAEASRLPVEELAKRARTVRDMLDPVGAEERYGRRFENRGLRMWTDADGQERGTIAFDDEMGAFVRSMLAAGLRPRRGGPRFMTDEERAAAESLIDDPRTNDQLAYDLLMDMTRAGALAEAKRVFGSRQPGVRMVVVKDAGPRDAFGRLVAVGHDMDGGCALPGSVIDRNACSNGFIEVIVDPEGNPFDLGREARMYSAAQRVALAVRDGGCVWPGCDRPPSYCEAHHCDHFAEGGETNVDRGVLLGRFHHMKLHNTGWRITRDGKGPFVLRPPAGEGAPIVLVSKAAWSWAWDSPRPPDRAEWRQPPDLPPRPGSPGAWTHEGSHLAGHARGGGRRTGT
ncbi:HNH endonuclease signature motif containing protein [Microbacterium sp. LWH3-1.2]|uniref:HNH endonuclease signature motif containing protein n=1 Tax=Microbacterium sp. LWH3-1.2 TaxID=3135256 RepID=UPI00343D7088